MKNGEMYEGVWENNMRTGMGTATYPNRDVYQGLWLNGLVRMIPCSCNQVFYYESSNNHRGGYDFSSLPANQPICLKFLVHIMVYKGPTWFVNLPATECVN